MIAVFLLMAAASESHGQPEWIWSTEKDSARPDEVVFFRRAFNVADGFRSATLYGTCDNFMTVWINGEKVLESDEWQKPVRVDIAKYLVPGGNAVAVQAGNDGGTTAGMLMRIRVRYDEDRVDTVETGSSWRWSREAAGGWMVAGFEDSGWTEAVSGGKLGVPPWGELGQGSRPTPPGTGIAPESLQVLDGFHVERIYDVPRNTQGSWVALTTGPDGTLFASDQGGQGLYQIFLRNGSVVDVVKQNVDISGAQGLVWAFDSLYANLSGRGLFRAYDSSGDGVLDAVEQLPGAGGGGEHGNHAVILTEDRENLYVVGGNHTRLPDFVENSRLSMNWQEDLLLPRQWDARGHARGVMAPGGWIAEMSPEGKNWEVISVGYRNQYDIAINRHGEMFTYDADMEWDMGMPWYRPTRICHVTSGSEYGWRSGTGKWPEYYEDSLPPVVEIGPGSPTGVVFGTGASFPAKYQDALYALDWTFGTVYAIHLIPDGAGYTGVKEEFIAGSPFPVTDAIVGEDGALYISIGGRGTQSALYRVTYRGTESTAPARGVRDAGAARARALRRSIEVFHGKESPVAIARSWPYLSSGDRFLRYAARIAVESQPVDTWKEKAFREPNARARINAIIAWARSGAEADRPEAIASLLRINPAMLDTQDQLTLLRAYALIFIRQGRPSGDASQAILNQINTIDLNGSRPLQAEWTRLSVYLDSPLVVEKALSFMLDGKPEEIPEWGQLIARNSGYGGTISSMLNDMPPTSRIQFALMLRNVPFGWTLEQRRQYFSFLNEAARHPGGASYTGFLENIRKEALANCTESERVALADLTGEDLAQSVDFDITPPEGPGRNWSHEEALAAVQNPGTTPDFQSGRNLFHATACAACHLFAGMGGAIGPDLSSVRNKFSVSELLESIIHPSRVISDQYGSSIVTTRDGDSVTGRVLEKRSDDGQAYLEVYTQDHTAPPVRVPESSVASVKQSPVSQMPPGLINALNASELNDLVAYLMSRGNPDDPMFKKQGE